MRKMLLGFGLLFFSFRLSAQTPWFIMEVIKSAIVKVIRAVDLKIQRLQNETIWLQNAQKVMENTLNKLRLEEIAGWSEKQRVLYADYFEELYKVKSFIAYYQRVRDVTQKQMEMVRAYKDAWSLFRSDPRFTPSEINHMLSVYEGIITESIKNLDEIKMVLTPFSMRMSDAKRLEIIDAAIERMDKNYRELLDFNQQNISVSIERAKSLSEIETLRMYYGIE